MFFTRNQIGHIQKSMDRDKMVFLFGPRQVGKTTTAKNLFNKEGGQTLYLDCGLQSDREVIMNQNISRVATDLARYQNIIIDEAQKVDQVGDFLKNICDHIKGKKYIVTGSSSLDLMQDRGDSMAGRTIDITMLPLTLGEIIDKVGSINTKSILDNLLAYGLYPEVASMTVEKAQKEDVLSQIKSIAESSFYKDIYEIDGVKKPVLLVKLLKKLAYRVGSEISIGSLANELDTTSQTISRYIDILEKMYVVFTLKSFNTNKDSEITKGLKVFFWDTGIRNYIVSENSINSAKNNGGVVENFIIAETVKQSNILNNGSNFYYWRNTRGAEIDLIEVDIDQNIYATEVKKNQSKARKSKLPLFFKENYPSVQFKTVSMDSIIYDLLEKEGDTQN